MKEQLTRLVARAAADPARRRRARAARRLRQRRQPAADPRRRAPARAGHPLGARCRALARRAPAADRERPPRARRRRGRPGRGVVGRPRCCNPSKSLPIPLVNPIRDRPVRPAVHARGRRAHRPDVRDPAGAPGVGHAAERRTQVEQPRDARHRHGARGGCATGSRSPRSPLSLALLVGAGLLLRSFDNMRHAETRRRTRATSSRWASTCPRRDTRRRRPAAAFFDRLLERAALVARRPGRRRPRRRSRSRAGATATSPCPGRTTARLKNQLFEWNYVTPDYFRAFGIPLLQGRNFTQQDEDQAAEVGAKARRSVLRRPTRTPDGRQGPLVARRRQPRDGAPACGPSEDPIGRTFVLGGALTRAGDRRGRRREGAGDPQRGPARRPTSLRRARSSGPGFSRYLVVKTAAAPMTLLASVRAHVNALDSALAVIQPRTMEDVVSRRHGGHQPADVAAGRRSPPWPSCSPPSACTASWRFSSRSGRTRSAIRVALGAERARSPAARPRPRRQAGGRRPARRRVRRARG